MVVALKQGRNLFALLGRVECVIRGLLDVKGTYIKRKLHRLCVLHIVHPRAKPPGVAGRGKLARRIRARRGDGWKDSKDTRVPDRPRRKGYGKTNRQHDPRREGPRQDMSPSVRVKCGLSPMRYCTAQTNKDESHSASG